MTTDRGDANHARVRVFFETHLCATQRECAAALGLSVMAINRHVKKIREGSGKMTKVSKECRQLVALILRINGAVDEKTSMDRREVEAHYLARLNDHGGSLEKALKAAKIEHHVLVELGLAE